MGFWHQLSPLSTPGQPTLPHRGSSLPMLPVPFMLTDQLSPSPDPTTYSLQDTLQSQTNYHQLIPNICSLALSLNLLLCLSVCASQSGLKLNRKPILSFTVCHFSLVKPLREEGLPEASLSANQLREDPGLQRQLCQEVPERHLEAGPSHTNIRLNQSPGTSLNPRNTYTPG